MGSGLFEAWQPFQVGWGNRDKLLVGFDNHSSDFANLGSTTSSVVSKNGRTAIFVGPQPLVRLNTPLFLLVLWHMKVGSANMAPETGPAYLKFHPLGGPGCNASEKERSREGMGQAVREGLGA